MAPLPIADTAALLVAAPLTPGLINRVKAFFAGRRGPGAFQLYHDLAKLWRKDAVVGSTTTWVFQLGPALGLAATLAAALLLPLGPRPGPAGFAGDFVAFAALIAVGRFFTTLTALDTGSAFGGMGAARELTLSSLAEPALLLSLLALARISGSPRLGGLLEAGTRAAGGGAALALAAGALFVVLLAENCRLPVDDPQTHLELTMVHEAMLLDHGGPLLALALYASALRLTLFAALLARMLLPGPCPPAGPRVALAAGVAGVALAVGVLESALARWSLRRVPVLLLWACLLAGFSLLLALA